MKLSSVVSGFGRTLAILVAIAGLGVLTLVVAPSVYGQRGDRPERPLRELSVLAGRGAEIGVSIRDLGPSDRGAAGNEGRASSGVIVEDVRPDSPADKAGLKRSDLIVEFDGEHVRSARQFARLVQETAPGRTVKATIVHDGQRRDLQLTPGQGRSTAWFDGERWREQFGDFGRLYDRLPPFDFNFDLGLGTLDPRGRLGVSVHELTPQLAGYFGVKDGVLVAGYFGVKDGVLVAAVTDDSPAAHAGLKAGDVITTINGQRVRSRGDLVRELSDLKGGEEVTIVIVRDKKESTVTAKLETRRLPRSGRPV